MQHASKENFLILDEVRAGFAAVADMARHVRIRKDLLDSYAASLQSLPPGEVFDSAHHYLGGAEDTAAYVIILDALNFGSGYKKDLVDEGWTLINGSIYFAVSTWLKHYFDAHGALDAGALTEMTPDRCRAMLELPHGPRGDEFARLCADSLVELGEAVLNRYGGTFMKMIEAANGSAERMVDIMAALPHFRDVHRYRGLDVHFYKRAQITAADLQLAFTQLGQTLFSDIKRLTMFPDNAVPHVLRMDGILEYTDALAAHIDAGQVLEAGSEEEIELRACAGQVVELLAAFKNICAMDIDHILWHRSVDDPRYREKPAHRTRTIYY